MGAAGMLDPDVNAVDLSLGLKQPMQVAKAPGSHSALPLVKLL
jgi:hypothetical protein